MVYGLHITFVTVLSSFFIFSFLRVLTVLTKKLLNLFSLSVYSPSVRFSSLKMFDSYIFSCAASFLSPIFLVLSLSRTSILEWKKAFGEQDTLKLSFWNMPIFTSCFAMRICIKGVDPLLLLAFFLYFFDLYDLSLLLIHCLFFLSFLSSFLSFLNVTIFPILLCLSFVCLCCISTPCSMSSPCFKPINSLYYYACLISCCTPT